MVEPSVTAIVPAVKAPAVPLHHSKISPSHGVAGRLTVRETEATVEITVDAVVLVRVDKVPEVRAVVITPVELRICAVVVKNDVPPGPPEAIDHVSDPVRVRDVMVVWARA